MSNQDSIQVSTPHHDFLKLGNDLINLAFIKQISCNDYHCALTTNSKEDYYRNIYFSKATKPDEYNKLCSYVKDGPFQN